MERRHMGNKLNKNAQGYGYKYTDIAEIHNWLEEQGYQYRQYIEVIEGNDYIVTVPIMDGKDQPPLRGCRVVNAALTGKTNPAQEQGAAITYARRYSLLMAFGLATTDDDADCLTKQSQIETQKIGQAKVNSIIKKCADDNIDVSVVLEKTNVKSLHDLTERQYAWVCHYWTKEILNGDKGKN